MTFLNVQFWSDNILTLFKSYKYLCLIFITTPASVGFFIDIKSFRSHYGPGVDSASNRNEYQEHFLVVKAAGA